MSSRLPINGALVTLTTHVGISSWENTARGLRKKLEPDPAFPRMIVNEPAVGYRLVDPAI